MANGYIQDEQELNSADQVDADTADSGDQDELTHQSSWRPRAEMDLDLDLDDNTLGGLGAVAFQEGSDVMEGVEKREIDSKVTHGVSHLTASSGPARAGIEVVIPRMPDEKKAEYTYVSVLVDEVASERYRGGEFMDLKRPATVQDDDNGKKRKIIDDSDSDKFHYMRTVSTSSSALSVASSQAKKSRNSHSLRPRSTAISYDDSLHLNGGETPKRGRPRITKADPISLSSDEDQQLQRAPLRNSRQKEGRRLSVKNLNHISKQDEIDELQQDHDDDESDADFLLVKSDVQPQKTVKRRKFGSHGRPAQAAPSLVDSDIEFEARRSSRANKNSKSMKDPAYADDDDDIFYVAEEKASTTPKIAGMREVFQPPKATEFVERHRPICDLCNLRETSIKGPLIFCQGCSNTYHKPCIGIRSAREHRVTKVAEDSFVLQCQHCVGRTKGRPVRGPERPRHGTCAWCRAKGPACAAFAPKRTPKVEEKLREENNGVDPITEVCANLIDNAENILFRCWRCRCAYHYTCLPHPHSSPDPAVDQPEKKAKVRFDEYSITWQCQHCNGADEKIQKLVAWRPAEHEKYSGREIHMENFGEEDLEYLIKWENRSYLHCVWKPGGWVYGFSAATMRQAFYKRHFELEDISDVDDDDRETLLKMTTESAIPETFLTPEIILEVQWAPMSKNQEMKYRQLSLAGRKQFDMNRMTHVVRIHVKYEGLGYEDCVWEVPPDPKAGLRYAAFVEAYEDFLSGKHFQHEPVKAMSEQIQKFRSLNFDTDVQYHKPEPKGLRGTLMDYQREGLNWLLLNYMTPRSVILADEMGLGKTVQVVVFLRSLVLDKPRVWPFLVVVPNATCPNWRREIKKWAPELRVVLYYGGSIPQDMAYKNELFPDGSRNMNAHVVVMSYQSAIDSNTRYRFSHIKWQGLVIDEAHALKNEEAHISKALKAMNIRFSLLLTGTPLQNNKKELFTLVQFVDPTKKAAALDEEYADISNKNIGKLHDEIRKYFLRRTKSEVLGFLPPMAQVIVPLSMSVLQEKLCKSILEKKPELIRAIFAQKTLQANEKTGMNNILMQLRKCLCHPFIYSQAIEDQGLPPEVAFRRLIEASPKLVLLELMLPKLKERGRRVLLFSQFLGQLDVLEDFLTGVGLKFNRIDGSMASLQKQKRIDQFNAPGSDIFAMLLSTRAGGVGINLATADTVIILDPDWNPHQDIQALARAHRIGQKKKVLCFQFMTQDSAEEKIMQMGKKKMALDHALIETMDDEKEGATSQHDIEGALRFGAAALFGDGERKEAIVYDSAALDDLLDRSEQEPAKMEADPEKSHESAFAFARVWARDGVIKDQADAEEQAVNLSIWDNIIREREEEARREAERDLQILGRGGRRRQAANYKMDGGAAVESDASPDEDFVGSDSGSDTETGKSNRSQNSPGANDARKGKTVEGQKTGQRASEVAAPARVNQANLTAPVAPVLSGAEGQAPTAKRGRPRKTALGPTRPKQEECKQPQEPESKGTNATGVVAARDPGDRKGAALGRTRQPVIRRLPMHHCGSGQPAGAEAGAGPNLGVLAQQNGLQQGASQWAWDPEVIRLLGAQLSHPGQLRSAKTTNSFAFQPVHPKDTQFTAQPMQPRPQYVPSQVSPQHQHPTAVTASLDRETPVQPVPPRSRLLPQYRTSMPPFRNQDAPCFVCHFNHPVQWECPEMSQILNLRMALDGLRRTDMSPEQKASWQAFLLARCDMLGSQRSG